MNRTIGALAAAVVLLVALRATSGDRLFLSAEGYGAAKFGVKLVSIEKKLGQRAEPKKREPGCDFVTFAAYPGIRFMVEDGIVTRGDASESTIPNSVGIVIGTSFTDVKRRYPKAIIKNHKYDPNGHYVIFKSKDEGRAIVFEEGEGKITDVRAGLEPSVEYVEGCL